MRRLYLVTYDICEPRRLRKVFKTMQGFGEHLQLSVFQCDLTAIDRVEMQAALSRQQPLDRFALAMRTARGYVRRGSWLG